VGYRCGGGAGGAQRQILTRPQTKGYNRPRLAEGVVMRQVQIGKRHRPARVWAEPLPPDARDLDIVRAKQLARRASPAQRRPRHTPA